MTLKLYGSAGSTCTGRVLATLYEKNVTDFELVKVDLTTGAHKQPEFLKLQPFGVIPVLVDGSLTIFESRAISRYISTKYGSQGTQLSGSSHADAALVDTWFEVESHNYNPAISAIVAEKVFKPWRGGVTDEAVLKVNVEKLNKVLDIYEAHLAENKYLAGSFYSLADLSHLPYTHYLIHLAKLGDLIESRVHVKRWWEDISSRPSWKKTLDLAAQK